MPVLDGNVFDIGFDILYGVPSILKVDIPREHRKVIAGQVVLINVYIINVIDPVRRYLFNPSLPPIITIFYPDKTTLVASAPMLNVSAGIYQYRHQTGVRFDSTVLDVNVFDSILADPIGIYTGHFFTGDGSNYARTIPTELYEVI